jgi:hypothetical protein
MSANKANYSQHHDGVRVRVVCPECNAGGQTYINLVQPKCHECKDGTLMEPASNTETVCTWKEAVDYSNNHFKPV